MTDTALTRPCRSTPRSTWSFSAGGPDTQVPLREPDRAAKGRHRARPAPRGDLVHAAQGSRDEEAVLLATEIASLPPLDRDVVNRVLEEFVGKLSTTRSIGQGGIAQHVGCSPRHGEERAAQVMPQLQGKVATGPLASLSQAIPSTSCRCSSTSTPRRSR